MFIVWQSGQDVVRAGDAADQHCHNCGRDCPHSIMVRYSYTDFYWVLGFVSKTEYFQACDRCNASIQLPKAEAKAICPHLPIPFMRRFGCLSVIAVFGLIAVFSAVFRAI
jgi:hypothetical protein